MSSLIRGKVRGERGGENEQERLADTLWTAVPREHECQAKGIDEMHTKARRRKRERKEL